MIWFRFHHQVRHFSQAGPGECNWASSLEGFPMGEPLESPDLGGLGPERLWEDLSSFFEGKFPVCSYGIRQPGAVP